MTSSLEELKQLLLDELVDALHSRRRGNEGRARVCSRRAAGWAVGWYVETKDLGEPHTNALDHLSWLVDRPGVEPELQQAAKRLTTKIDGDGKFPFQQDPIEDAQLIITGLLGINISHVELDGKWTKEESGG